MIEIIQMWIWNIGGFLLTVMLILFILTAMLSWIINRLSWWHNPESRRNLFYWIRHKKEISKIIEEQKLKEK